MAVIYNPETEKFIRDPATIIDSSAGGDTVKQGFEDRTEPALEGIVSAFNLLKTEGMIGVGVPATETARGISRMATKTEASSGIMGINGPAFVTPAQLVGSPKWRPGQKVELPGTKLYPNCVWPDRSLVLFADWPELHAEFTADYLGTVTEADAAEFPDFFVLKADGSGLYLPDVGGLFARAWRPGEMQWDKGRLAGSYQADQMQGHRHNNTGLRDHFATTRPFPEYDDVQLRTGNLGGHVLGVTTDPAFGEVKVGAETRSKSFAQPIAIYLGRHASEV